MLFLNRTNVSQMFSIDKILLVIVYASITKSTLSYTVFFLIFRGEYYVILKSPFYM